MCDRDVPYCVPMLYCYRGGGVIYLHSSEKGRKMDILRRGGRICFRVELDAEVVKRGRPCSWTVRYRSVIGWGRATLVTDPSERRRALGCLIRKVASRYDYDLSEEELVSVAVIRMDLEEVSGKVST